MAEEIATNRDLPSTRGRWWLLRCTPDTRGLIHVGDWACKQHFLRMPEAPPHEEHCVFSSKRGTASAKHYYRQVKDLSIVPPHSNETQFGPMSRSDYRIWRKLRDKKRYPVLRSGEMYNPGPNAFNILRFYGELSGLVILSINLPVETYATHTLLPVLQESVVTEVTNDPRFAELALAKLNNRELLGMIRPMLGYEQ